MRNVNMAAVNLLADFATRVVNVAPKAATVTRTTLSTYAYALDCMLARASIAARMGGYVRAARLLAYRRRAKPYTLGQIRAHVKYRLTHQPEIHASYARIARSL